MYTAMTDEEKMDKLDGVFAGIHDPSIIEYFKENKEETLNLLTKLAKSYLCSTVSIYTLEDINGLITWAECELDIDF